MFSTRTTNVPGSTQDVDSDAIPPLCWALLVTALGLLGFVGYLLVGTANEALDYLASRRWDFFLAGRELPHAEFFGRCFMRSVCKVALDKKFSELLMAPKYMAAGGGVMLLLVGALMTRPRRAQKSGGGSAFASLEDVKAAGFVDEGRADQRGTLGFWPRGRFAFGKATELVYTDKQHTRHSLVIGGTGTGKTGRVIIPNILKDAKAGRSAIVIDPKFPDIAEGLSLAIPAYEKHGHRVLYSCVGDPATMCLPVLPRNMSEKDASFLADALMPYVEDASAFFKDYQRTIIKTIVMAFSRVDQYGTGLGDLFNIIAQGMPAIKKVFHEAGDSKLTAEMKLFFETKDADNTKFLQGIISALSPLQGGDVNRAFALDPNPLRNIDLMTLVEEPTLFYIGIPTSQLLTGQGQRVIKFYKQYIDFQLSRLSETFGGQLPRSITYYVDEFANLGRLANATTNFAMLRSVGVSMFVGTQNESGLIEQYGDATLKAILGNISTIITFPQGLSREDKETYSKMAGMIEVEEQSSRQERIWFFHWHKGRTIRKVERPLVSEREMSSMPEGMALIHFNNMLPVKAVMPAYFQDRHLGIKNPLAKYREDLPKLFDPRMWSLNEQLTAKWVFEGSETEPKKRYMKDFLRQRTLETLRHKYEGGAETKPALSDEIPVSPQAEAPPSETSTTASTKPLAKGERKTGKATGSRATRSKPNPVPTPPAKHLQTSIWSTVAEPATPVLPAKRDTRATEVSAPTLPVNVSEPMAPRDDPPPVDRPQNRTTRAAATAKPTTPVTSPVETIEVPVVAKAKPLTSVNVPNATATVPKAATPKASAPKTMPTPTTDTPGGYLHGELQTKIDSDVKARGQVNNLVTELQKRFLPLELELNPSQVLTSVSFDTLTSSLFFDSVPKKVNNKVPHAVAAGLLEQVDTRYALTEAGLKHLDGEHIVALTALALQYQNSAGLARVPVLLKLHDTELSVSWSQHLASLLASFKAASERRALLLLPTTRTQLKSSFDSCDTCEVALPDTSELHRYWVSSGEELLKVPNLMTGFGNLLNASGLPALLNIPPTLVETFDLPVGDRAVTVTLKS